MVVKKAKKITKQRGSRTCGWGLVHRGSGQRGGSGNAGYYQAKKPSIWKEKQYGKIGFKYKGLKNEKTINLRTLAQQIPRLINEKKATKDNEIRVNLDQLGYTKILGTGKALPKLNITIAHASSGAIEKVKQAGGTITLSQK